MTTAWGLVDGKLGRLATARSVAPEYESCRRIAVEQGCRFATSMPQRSRHSRARRPLFNVERGHGLQRPGNLCLIVLVVAAVAIVVLTRVRLARAPSAHGRRQNWAAERRTAGRSRPGRPR